jgi:hypothetical protein
MIFLGGPEHTMWMTNLTCLWHQSLSIPCARLKVVAKVVVLCDTAGVEGERGVANIAAHGIVGTRVLNGLSTLVILCP